MGLRITIAAVGRLKKDYLEAAEAEYRKRLRPYCTLEVAEHKSEAALLGSLSPQTHLYALDERGDLLSSEDLAHGILAREEQHGGGAPVVFAIGAADGHSEALRTRATRLLAFGRMTIAHRLMRVLLLEQLYRGFTIIRGLPYHRSG